MVKVFDQSFKTIEDYVKSYGTVPEELLGRCAKASVIIVPAGYPQAPHSFPTGTTDIFKYLRTKIPDVEIFSTPETYSELSLNSNEIRLGKYIVTYIGLPVLINLLSSYLYDKSQDVTEQDTAIEYSQPTKVDVSITVVDSANTKMTKEFRFEGNAKDFRDACEEMKQIWGD